MEVCGPHLLDMVGAQSAQGVHQADTVVSSPQGKTLRPCRRRSKGTDRAAISTPVNRCYPKFACLHSSTTSIGGSAEGSQTSIFGEVRGATSTARGSDCDRSAKWRRGKDCCVVRSIDAARQHQARYGEHVRRAQPEHVT
eukprot:scaffold100774_cov30-Tisochrysis_lutea.AAC.4